MGKISSLFRKKADCVLVNEEKEEIIFKYVAPGIKEVMILDKKYSALDREDEEVRLAYLREQTLLYFGTFVDEGKEEKLTAEIYDDLDPSIIIRLWTFIALKQNVSSFRKE